MNTLLIGLGDKAATLSVAGRQQNIPLAALEQRYAGDYATFWRAPRGWREQVGGGDHGADVDDIASLLGHESVEMTQVYIREARTLAVGADLNERLAQAMIGGTQP